MLLCPMNNTNVPEIVINRIRRSRNYRRARMYTNESYALRVQDCKKNVRPIMKKNMRARLN